MEKFHTTFAWIVVLTVGLIVSIVELPIKAICFIVALVLYTLFSLTAPLWVNTNISWCGDFIMWSFSIKCRIALKVMKAYAKALGL